VNDDTYIRIGDVAATIDLILSGGYDEAADLDGDSLVNIADLESETLEQLLGIENTEPGVAVTSSLRKSKATTPNAALSAKRKVVPSRSAFRTKALKKAEE